MRARLCGDVQPHSSFGQSLWPGSGSKFKVQGVQSQIIIEQETSTFREFSKRGNGARIEELTHCNEPALRGDGWSKAIAVGSLPFVEKVQSEIGINALHRQFEPLGEAYALRE